MQTARSDGWKRAALAALRVFTVLAACAALHASPADARVDCAGSALSLQVEHASHIFVGRLEGPGEVVAPLSEDERGIPDMRLTFVVVTALKGNLEPGARVTVRWRGFVEPRSMRAGGCSVPGWPEPGRAAARYPETMLVLAQGEPDSLQVPNVTRSARLRGRNRSLVERVVRIVRRRR